MRHSSSAGPRTISWNRQQRITRFLQYRRLWVLITHHRKYLEVYLHPNSILQSTSLLGEDILFKDKVVANHQWDKTDNTPKIVGLPLDIVLMAKLESMQLKMATLKVEPMLSFELRLVKQLNQLVFCVSDFTYFSTTQHCDCPRPHTYQSPDRDYPPHGVLELEIIGGRDKDGRNLSLMMSEIPQDQEDMF